MGVVVTAILLGTLAGSIARAQDGSGQRSQDLIRAIKQRSVRANHDPRICPPGWRAMNAM
jgi:hypothetical protein